MATCGGVETIIFNCNQGYSDNPIINLLIWAVKLLFGGVGLLGTIGIIICGVIWLTAGDNESRVIMARKRLTETVIGVILAACLFFSIDLLIPGGTDIQIDDGGGGGSSVPSDPDPVVTPTPPTGHETYINERV